MKTKKGQIIKGIGDVFLVLLNEETITCKARGNLKKNTLIVGDYVEINNINDEYIIENVYPRINSLIRPKIANVEQMIIVMSAVKPDFSTLLLDKFLLIAEFNSIKPIIYISKLDLIENEKIILDLLKYYKQIGYEVYTNSKDVKPLIKNKITVLTGQTGVGKSTLLNKLYPELNIETNEISKALNRGKHTTRHTTIYNLEGALIADTPGFSAFDLSEMTKPDIKTNYPDFINKDCKYSGCSHIKEPDCKIKEAVEKGLIPKDRYDNYIKLMSEVE